MTDFNGDQSPADLEAIQGITFAIACNQFEAQVLINGLLAAMPLMTVDIEVFFNPDDLIPILAKAVSPFFIHPVNPEDIASLEFEQDEEGDVTGVSIQLVRQIPPDEPT